MLRISQFHYLIPISILKNVCNLLSLQINMDHFVYLNYICGVVDRCEHMHKYKFNDNSGLPFTH